MRDLIEFVFFHIGSNTLLPNFLVSSIKRSNPSSYITQLTDMTSPQVAGTDNLYRYRFNSKAIMIARAEAYANLPPSGALRVFLDTDMLVVNEISSSNFKEDADIYLCRRHFGRDTPVNIDFRGMSMREYTGKTIDEAWPYLGCFIATKDNIYLQYIHERMRSMEEKYQNWYGDQISLKLLANLNEINLGTVSEEYFANLCNDFFETLAGVRSKSIFILHFKGGRKEKISKYFDAIFPSAR